MKTFSNDLFITFFFTTKNSFLVVFCLYEILLLSLHSILEMMKTINRNMDYIKANRKGSRDAELEDSSGWKSVHKVHKSNKNYSRKIKHRNNGIQLQDIRT